MPQPRRFELKGIPPMPAGIPKLRVEFLVDASGILTVRAAEERSGKRLEAQIVPNHGLTAEEVERIERESLTHAREDMTPPPDRRSHCQRSTRPWLDRQTGGSTRGRCAARVRAEVEAKREVLQAMVDRDADWQSVDPDAFYHAKEDLDRASCGYTRSGSRGVCGRMSRRREGKLTKAGRRGSQRVAQRFAEEEKGEEGFGSEADPALALHSADLCAALRGPLRIWFSASGCTPPAMPSPRSSRCR